MRIDERICRELGSYTVSLPVPGKKQWQRLDCPFCGHQRAVINYPVNWFQCWACGRKLSGYDADTRLLLVVRFAKQVDRAAEKVKKDFGLWLNSEDDDVYAEARFLVWNYAEGEPGDKYSAGLLPKWELEYNAEDEPWRIEGKIQAVLDRDMHDWAKGLKTWKQANQVAGSMSPEDNGVDNRTGNDTADREDEPVIGVGEGAGRKTRNRNTRIATKYGLRNRYFHSAEPPGTKLGGPMRFGQLRRCDLIRNGAGPMAGHCRWCDKRLGGGNRGIRRA